MKKITLLILTGLFIISLAACTLDPIDDNDSNDVPPNDDLPIIDDYYDYSDYAADFDHAYPHTSSELTIVFGNEMDFYYSRGDAYSDSVCVALDGAGEVAGQCEKSGTVDTLVNGIHEVVYYAIDGKGNYASIAFEKKVFLDASVLEAELPEYYAGLEGLYGEALKDALHDLLQEVNLGNYGDARYRLQVTDQDPQNPDHVIQLYTRESVDKTWHCPDTHNCNWNREHVFPVSRMPISRPSNNDSNMGSDLHALAPEDIHENSYRAAKNFTETHSNETYSPVETVRGNVARMMFYMEVMYTDLSIVVGLGNASNYELGDLNYLLKWHFDDPISDFEINRNELIYGYQNNRNPFIDVPHFVQLIYFDHPNLFDWIITD